jgi:hypothetical protein
VVNDFVIQADVGACQTIVSKIVNDKLFLERKQELLEQDRQKQRMKLISTHNNKNHLEKKCGVKLASHMSSTPST